ncbi:hypothetical protein BDV93DRAFT_581942 [Ceratobasidium sp. AG-I]|nr:hypothetical protein BDV93DRAFT_581942 [Ceratobasidium sp. AG-I]
MEDFMAYTHCINGQSIPDIPVESTTPSRLSFPTALTSPFGLPNLNTAQPTYTQGPIPAIPDHDDAPELPNLGNPNDIVFPMYRRDASTYSVVSNSTGRSMKHLLFKPPPTSSQPSYRPHQLSKLLLKSENSSDHLRRIHVTKSQYCRKRTSGQEFIVFSILDSALPRISNWLILDRNGRSAMKDSDSAESQNIAQCWTFNFQTVLDRLQPPGRFYISNVKEEQAFIEQNVFGEYEVQHELFLPSDPAFSLDHLLVLASGLATPLRFRYPNAIEHLDWYTKSMWEAMQLVSEFIQNEEPLPVPLQLRDHNINAALLERVLAEYANNLRKYRSKMMRRQQREDLDPAAQERRHREVEAEVERHIQEIENQRNESLRLEQEQERLNQEQEAMRAEIERLRVASGGVGRREESPRRERRQGVPGGRGEEMGAGTQRPILETRNFAEAKRSYLYGKDTLKNPVDPEVYKIPRNHYIFPFGLGSYTESKEAPDHPLQYTLVQLKFLLQRSIREEDDTERIYVASAEYCKRLDHVKHEFLLLEVRDTWIPQISNYVVLERTVDLSSGAIAAASTSSSSGSPAQDRLRVCSYGEKHLLTKQCGLRPYDVLERLEQPSPSVSTPLLLRDVLILALETSKSRHMYHLITAQCYWFASCIWECMLKLRPEAYRTPLITSKGRGKFGRVFKLDVNSLEINEISHKAESEIRQFLRELAIGKNENEKPKTDGPAPRDSLTLLEPVHCQVFDHGEAWIVKPGSQPIRDRRFARNFHPARLHQQKPTRLRSTTFAPDGLRADGAHDNALWGAPERSGALH